VLGEVLSVVADLSPHIVNEERLSEVEFVVRVGHGLEVQSHSGTAFDVANLEAAVGRVAVNIEELGDLLAVLGEMRVATALFPLLIEVHHVVGLWCEQATQFLVSKQLVKHVNLIDGGLSTLISDAGSGHKSRGKEVDLPERSMSEHHEGEATIGDEHLRPHVVGAVKARTDLVKIVARTHAPFPVISVHHVGYIGVLGRVTFSLGSLSAVGCVVRRSRTDVVTILALRGLEAHVVIAWLVVLAEAELGHGCQEGIASLGGAECGLQHYFLSN